MTPAPDNRAANSLSIFNQERNMKNVAVNTKITMVVLIMESIANICIMLSWIIGSGMFNIIALTIVIFWYYVIIPYTFLMNTSFNKERIIDEGWKTVILNIIIKPYLRFSNFSSFELQSRSIQMSKDTKGNTSGNENDVSHELITNRPLQESHDLKSSDKPHEKSISIIAIKEFDRSKFKTGQTLEMSDLETLPSTSMNKNTTILDQEQNHLVTRCSSSDSESDKDSKKFRLMTRKEILANMEKHIYNNDAYFHFFHQLMKFEQILVEDKLEEIDSFHVKPYQNVKRIKLGNVKNLNSRNRPCKEVAKGKNMDPLVNTKSKNEFSSPSVNTKINDNQTYLMKLQLRRAAIKQLAQICKHWDDEDVYKDFFNGLVDLEEALAEGLMEI